MAKRFRITFVVRESLVGTIVGLLLGRDVESFKVEEVDPVRPANGGGGAHVTTGRGPPTKQYANPEVVEAVLAYMKKTKGPHWYKDLAKQLPAAGLKPSSITPLLTGMVRAGKVKRASRGYYKLEG